MEIGGIITSCRNILLSAGATHANVQTGENSPAGMKRGDRNVTECFKRKFRPQDISHTKHERCK